MIFLLVFLIQLNDGTDKISLPVKVDGINTIDQLPITAIGNFSEWRKARTKVPAHFHTGIDIKRPGKNYKNEFIYPIAKGYVISKRADGPFAELIIEHEIDNTKFWTVYEHIAGISVNLNEEVDPQNYLLPII